MSVVLLRNPENKSPFRGPVLRWEAITEWPVHVKINYAVLKVVGRCFLWSKAQRLLVTFLCCSIYVHSFKVRNLRAEMYKEDKRIVLNTYTVLSNIS